MCGMLHRVASSLCYSLFHGNFETVASYAVLDVLQGNFKAYSLSTGATETRSSRPFHLLYDRCETTRNVCVNSIVFTFLFLFFFSFFLFYRPEWSGCGRWWWEVAELIERDAQRERQRDLGLLICFGYATSCEYAALLRRYTSP